MLCGSIGFQEKGCLFMIVMQWYKSIVQRSYFSFSFSVKRKTTSPTL
jgi:hypothetical protein